MAEAAPVSAIIVCSFEDPQVVSSTVASLRAQTRPPAEILVVDNHPDAVISSELAARGLPIRPLPTGSNLGYPQACNFAARHVAQPWMFFLNPDAQADPRCLEGLLEAADDDVAVLGAQVLLADGTTVNAGDNPINLAGLSWAGRYLEPAENGPPRDVAAISGAASLIRTDVFRALRGHSPGFFLYHDDVDIAWRARMGGWRVRFVPGATIVHDYEFDKGRRKWFHLEHNRLWTVLANYELRTLLLLLPVLLAAEAGTALLARRDGWWPEKAEAWRTVARERGRIRAWRRFVQGQRTVADGPVLSLMTASVTTPAVAAPFAGAIERLLELYRRFLIAALGA